MPEKKKKHDSKKSEKEIEVKEMSIRKQKMRGGLLMLIGFGTLIFVGYFLFGKFFRPQSLAELLPAQRSVALLEINVDGNSGQVGKFYELLADYPVYRQSAIIALLNTTLPLNYQNELEPWLGRQVGLALLSTKDGAFEPLFFIESRDHNRALEFFRSRGLDTAPSGEGEELVFTNHNGFALYEFTISQSMSFTFINNYVVVAQSKEALMTFLDQYMNAPRLSDDQDYRKVANNLPQGGLLFAFVNYRNLFSTLEEDELFVTQKGQDLLALRPFINVFRAEGVSVFAENDRFVAQNFTSIDTEALGEEEYITFDEPYKGNLLRLINPDPIFLAGGHDLTRELNRIEEIFKSGTKTPALVFEGLVEAQKQRYFGKDIGLKEDIYPLFTGEYLITIEKSLEEPEVSILLELNDSTASSAHVDRIVNEFIQVSGVFSPEVKEVELPDGTMGKEIVASQEKVARSTSNYAGQTVTTLTLGDTGIALQYAIFDDIIAVSTDANSLKNMINRHEDETVENLTMTTYYERNLRPVLRTADQVVHGKIGAFTEFLGLSEDGMLAPYLVPLNNFTVTKKFFEDGISTTYLVEVL